MHYRRMENVNWRKVMQEIVDHYGNDRLAAEAIGCNQATAYRFRTGGIKEPSWTLGEKLLRVHERMRDDAA